MDYSKLNKVGFKLQVLSDVIYLLKQRAYILAPDLKLSIRNQ